MALSLVGVGTTANDGTGDPLRTAFQTVNTALTLINDAVVVGTGTTTFKDDSGTYGVAIASNGDVTFTTASAAAGMTWDASANTNTGGLGLGTTTPARRLHITGSGTTPLRLQSTGASCGIEFYDTATTTAPVIKSDSGQGLRFDTLGVRALVLGSNQDVFFFNSGASVGLTWDADAVSAAGGLGIGITAPSAALDINSDVFRLRTAKTPATAGEAGSRGDICTDSSYIYVHVGTGWKRAALSTW